MCAHAEEADTVQGTLGMQQGPCVVGCAVDSTTTSAYAKQQRKLVARQVLYLVPARQVLHLGACSSESVPGGLRRGFPKLRCEPWELSRRWLQRFCSLFERV